MSAASAQESSITALNFHVWQPCNMACRYCFAQFDDQVPQLRRDKQELRERALAVVEAAASAGIQKLTLVGGEPTLCPWLKDLLEAAITRGMVTMIVTNGTKVDEAWLQRHAECLNWAAVSVDSLDAGTNSRIGRRVGAGSAPDRDYYGKLFRLLNAAGIRTKVNTVVSAQNWQEDFVPFLSKARPERWKIFQALHIRGENDSAFPEFSVSIEQFQSFIERHEKLERLLTIAAEGSDDMLGSYLMVDPLGRFVTNIGGIYAYSKPIWDVGWKAAIAEAQFDSKKFVERGGIYNW
ncbi:viperin family antiviral radical SAM protein [Thiomonas sp. FB-Cd]|uniref:viperin family antiviral radical SAM protein n=1 Tax=Thiomonas sp. FB-Cd TaxID=1158292 RepID=UPI0018CC49EE|nr:viperin family antiviral radical SAM protein [Thiomonas sp. FB-Cd]